jgi:hypothetical protein
MFVVLCVMTGLAQAQQPAPAPAPAPAPTPAPAPAPAPAPTPAPAADPAADPATPTPTESPVSGMRVHVMTSRNTYVPMKFDVFSVDSRQLVASGSGALESSGEEAPILELNPGTYKIVRAGEPFETRVDFAIATVLPDTVIDYLIVVDPDSLAFRGSGPVIGELPRGVELLGLRLSLNGGGNLMFNQMRNAVGRTSGTTAQFGVFGNFGLVFDRGVHFVDVSATMRLDLIDPVTGDLTPTHDRFEAAGLYSYKLNSDFFGPYVRASMKTRIFPGYIYFENSAPTITVNLVDGDGNSLGTETLGMAADPDSLRYKVAKPFAPLQLQEELGANVKAVDLDLLLVKLNVGTRLGFGFRQTFTNDLFVLDGDKNDNPATLRRVDDYQTLGPVIGANASVTFARWLFGSAQFGLLVPVTSTDDSRSDNFAGRLLIDFSGSAGFKVPILTNLLFASADYTFRLERDAFITNDTQFEHALMARANVTLF